MRSIAKDNTGQGYYVRSHAAGALRSQRSHMAGILIPTLNYALYASLFGAANRQFLAAGISTLIATTNYDLENEFHEAKLLIERGVEALILIGQNHKPELYSLLEQYNTPYYFTYIFDFHADY